MVLRRARLGVFMLSLLVAACREDEVPSQAPPASVKDYDGGAPASPDGGPLESGSPSDAMSVLPAGSVRVEGGVVSGAHVDGLWAWKGIPYAAPPVADLRWRPPAPVVAWEGTKTTTAFGQRCPQLDEGEVVGAEDCLTLNVWAPANAKDAPVLVYVHGGGNVQGSASDPLYDGKDLAARTASIVVTFDYRLGALGFFAHAGLDAESAAKVSGNYGILDQQAALRWVKTNIAAFGGAPGKVMLFGESAGAQDTLVHVASPLSAGLFASAAVESGGVYRTTLAEAKKATEPLVAAAGCTSAADTATCMRQKSAADLVNVPTAVGPLDRSGIRYTPAVDGYVLPRNALDAISVGSHNRVPIILGTNADETSRMVPNVSTETEYASTLTSLYGAELATKVQKAYPASRFESPRKALIAVTTDATWTCPIRRLARALAANQSPPVYRYYFTWKPAGVAGAVTGATHGIDVPFVFRTFAAFEGFTPDSSATALSDAMQGYWSRLGAAADPNGEGAVAWPRYVADTDPYLQLDRSISAKTGLSTLDCNFLDALAP